MFESPMDLHYSQTPTIFCFKFHWFESPMDLHYSQTFQFGEPDIFAFESPMDLHYSQTISLRFSTDESLNPLWIYTTLKHVVTGDVLAEV